MSRRLSGLVASLLAVFTLVVAIPQHVLDRDDDGAAPAWVAATIHSPAHVLLDHDLPGHVCADHCAAHVLGGVPTPASVPAAIAVVAGWAMAPPVEGLSIARPPLKPPPKA